MFYKRNKTFLRKQNFFAFLQTQYLQTVSISVGK